MVSSREKAKQAIEDGLVKLNGATVNKASKKIKATDQVEISQTKQQFVSRSGHKLEAALKHFQISPRDFKCLDIGSSTGGFTECLLLHGAREVFSVDVGSDQLHPSLLGNPKIKLFENTDFRDFKLDIPDLDLVVIDVSFISLRKIVPNLGDFLRSTTMVLALFKPQFEVGKKHLKKGICRHPDLNQVIEEFRNFLQEYHVDFAEKPFVAPLKGKEGNQEYVIKFAPIT